MANRGSVRVARGRRDATPQVVQQGTHVEGAGEAPRHQRLYPFIAAFYAAMLIVSNVVAVKLANTPFGVVSASIICFPLTYAISDILTEVYGYALARRTVWIGFFCNFVAVLFFTLVGRLEPAGFWTDQPAYDAILGLVPRITIASFTAVLAGSFLNDFVLSRLKVATAGRHLWLRTIGSTAIGEGIDSLIFYTGAFYGILPTDALIQAIWLQWLLKTGYEVIMTPVTYPLVAWMKRLEGYDWFDLHQNYNPFKV